MLVRCLSYKCMLYSIGTIKLSIGIIARIPEEAFAEMKL